MLFRQLFSTATAKISVTRVVPTSKTSSYKPKFEFKNNGNSSSNSGNGKYKSKFMNKTKYTGKSNNSNTYNYTKPDDYAVCIKAKAIARSSGAETALSYALNRKDDKNMTIIDDDSIKSPVLLNTVLSAFSREGQSERFWQLYTSKSGEDIKWTPELAATLLNQLAIEGDKTNFDKAINIYCEALGRIADPHHCHIHNAFLKCIGRLNQSSSFLLWLLGKLNKKEKDGVWVDEAGAVRFGVKQFLPTTDSYLKLSVCLDKCIKKSVQLDSQSISSILAIISRSEDGSISMAESIWSKLPPTLLDTSAHLSLLLVYRNDLARILHHRKLIRSTGWRERKLSRVMQIIGSAGVDLTKDPKFLSVYYEICLNANLKERVREHVNLFKIVAKDDPRLETIIQKATNNYKNSNQNTDKIIKE